MRRWTHNVSAEWLEARRTVLAATDVASLMPEYKRSLKKDPGTLMPGSAALWASKHSAGDLDTSSPSPAAARGHIMEPWAVESWNAQVAKKFYHWDDCIICNSTLGLGFSPDAMDIMQVYSDARLEVSSDGKFLVNAGMQSCDVPTEIMEIKSYDVPRHMKAVIADKMDHDELMQIALAFIVLPKLEKARLLWFCPDAPISMHVETYTADDLQDQMQSIMELAQWYGEQMQLIHKLPKPNLCAQCTEEEVWEAFVAEQVEANDNNIFMLK